MLIEFKKNQLRKLCESEREMVREFGSKVAAKLQERLTEIDAATTLEDLGKVPQARLHPLKVDRKGEWAVDLGSGWRLCFEPWPPPVPKKPDGGVDPAKVTGVYITYIGNYHKG